MASAAAYADTASGIYDPQAAAESTQAGAARDASLSSLDSQEKQIDPYYKSAEDTLATATNDARAKTDFAYQSALDGNASGLEKNDNARTTNDYLKSLAGLTTEEANKHSDIAASRTLAQNTYQSTLAAITQKYAGLKGGYVADMLSHDADQAFQERMANNAAGTQLTIAKMNAAQYAQPAAPSTTQMLSKYFSGYVPVKQGGKAFFTERSVIPQLMADSGMSYNDAAKAAYAYRKQVFHE